jgi:predicted porin
LFAHRDRQFPSRLWASLHASNQNSNSIKKNATSFNLRRFVMNKKLIALAVAAATVAPVAFAQTANPVTLYGRMWVMAENVKADGGTAAAIGSRNRVSNVGSSLVGIRGTEDLGGGLKAFFQWETEVRQDQNDSPFSNRNSGVGLQGDFGSVLIGRWDTPMKLSAVQYDFFGTTTLAGYASAMADRGNFDRREQNVIQYWSPNWSGVSGRLSYSANEGKTATVNPKVVSGSLSYAKGPVSVSYAYEKHTDLFRAYATGGAATALSGAWEKGQSLGGSVTFGPVRLNVLTQRFKKFGGGTTVTSDQRANMIGLVYTMGKHQFAYQNQRAKDGATRATAAAVAAEPNSTVNSVGWYYNFTRRTTLTTVYTQVKNNQNGLSNFGANALAGLGAGQDPKGFGVGIRHTF